MATSLINTTPAATYESLLKLGDNSALSATLKRISDGAGNDTPIEISTAAVQFGGSTGMYWDNTNRRLGIGTNTPSPALSVIGASRLSDLNIGLTTNTAIGNTSNIIANWGSTGVGVANGAAITPTATFQVRGAGTTSATTALRIENSAGASLFDIRDDGYIVLPSAASSTTIGYSNASRSIMFNYTGGGVASGMKIQGFGGVALASYDGASYTDALTVTGNGTQRVGIGTNAPTTALDVNGSIRAGVNLTVVGEIQNPTVGVVNINGELRVASPNVSIGLTSYPARLAVRGSGATSATTALRVENSAGTASFTVNDAGAATVTSTLTCNSTIDVQGLVIGTGQRRLYSSSSSNANLVINTTGILASTSGFVASNASAVLEAVSTTQGFLPPRMTTTQKNTIASPAAGLMVYDTDTNKLCCYNGTTWNDLF